MKNWMIRFSIITVLVLSASLFANAQVTATTTIRAVKAESLSVSASALADYDLAALAPQTLTITSNWNLQPSKTSVAICTYMTVAGRMVGSDVSNTDVIDETMVQTSVSAGPWANINAGAGCGIAATLVNTYALTNQASRKNASHSDDVQIQLAGVPATIQADTYTGTITVQALAQ